MPIGTVLFVAKEATKKAIQESAKQVTKETKKDILKGKLKEAVKQEIKESVKDKIKEEIDESIDTRAVSLMSSLSKPDTLKGKLQESLKREAKENVRSRVLEDVNDNLVDTKAIQIVSRGVSIFSPEEMVDSKKNETKSEEKQESLKNKLDHAVNNPGSVEIHSASEVIANEEAKFEVEGSETKKKNEVSTVDEVNNEKEYCQNDVKERSLARTPENHGNWDGERGDSKWIPDKDYIPPEKSVNLERPYSNPDNLSWGELLKKYGIDGIPFKDGFPDFSEISKGTVEIEGFETGGSVEKNRNFKKADIVLAEQRGCTPEEVKKWREENNYTWHECEDKKTMQKVPNEVHANIPHDGGRSQKE